MNILGGVLMTLEGKKKFLINILFAIVAIALIYIVFKFLLSYLFPFIIGIALAALVQKPSEFIERKTKIKSGISAASMVFVFYISVILCNVTACNNGNYYGYNNGRNRLSNSRSGTAQAFCNKLNNCVNKRIYYRAYIKGGRQIIR